MLAVGPFVEKTDMVPRLTVNDLRDDFAAFFLCTRYALHLSNFGSRTALGLHQAPDVIGG